MHVSSSTPAIIALRSGGPPKVRVLKPVVAVEQSDLVRGSTIARCGAEARRFGDAV